MPTFIDKNADNMSRAKILVFINLYKVKLDKIFDKRLGFNFITTIFFSRQSGRLG